MKCFKNKYFVYSGTYVVYKNNLFTVKIKCT